MECSNCGQANPPPARFCLACGARLAPSCARCGTDLPDGARFCLHCGHPVSGRGREARFGPPDVYTPPHLAERILTSAVGGERKQVTVLFADLKGSMELLADRDPEDARALLDPVLQLMIDAVHRYEGTVNQVMGDGIMALFGAPLAHEDHAVRACYAALRMQAAVGQHAEGVRRREGVLVQIRVGLNSGEVVVRSIGSDLRMDYTAVGQTTHLAARMEQLAAPGTTLMAPETLRMAEGYVEASPLGPMSVRGLGQAVEVYQLTGAGVARTRLQAGAARGLTRFVGRDPEMDALRRAMAAAGSGRGQVVAVVGEPGVGKSRLFWELTHSHHVHGWLVLEAGSVSYGKATSYLPVIDLLKRYFKIQDRDGDRDIREKVAGKLLILDRALEPAQPALLSLLHLDDEDSAWQALDPTERRRRTLEAVKRLLLRESQVQPLLLIVEDLHWIDPETQEMLDSLIESVPAARMLLLVNYRPEYQHGWGSKTYYGQLRLDALLSDSAGELLEGLLGDDPGLGPLERLLIARTGGNPFFLEESVRTLVETGALAGERGAYRLAKPVGAVEVPASVQAVLAARIDRLAPEDKRVLQTAAVIGKGVPLPLLQDIADADAPALPRALARLQAAEFLYEQSLFPEIEYTFKHALTHEVAYGGLLHDRRRHLHASIVEAMERRYADRLNEHAERLADHAVRGEVWPRAVTHLWQAGRNARARSAYRQAVVFLEQALAILTRMPETNEHAILGIDLLCRDLWDPLSTLAQYERLLEHLREAAVLAEKIGDHARLADVLARTVSPLRLTGQHDRAVKTGERALALAKEVGDGQVSVLAGLELGFTHYNRGDLRRAEGLFTAALAALDSLPAGAGGPHNAWLRRRTLGGLVMILVSTGRYGEAVRHGEEALRMAEDLGHPAPIAGALYRLGWVHCERGEVGTAIDLCSRSVALARGQDVRDVLQWALARLGVAYTLAGRAEEAISCLEEAVTVGEATNSLDAVTLVSLGQAYLLAGRPEDASTRAREALVMSRQRARRRVEVDALHLIADIAARREPPAVEDAVESYGQALALAMELELPAHTARIHLDLGRLHRHTGDQTRAREHLSTALETYRELDAPFWVATVEAALTA